MFTTKVLLAVSVFGLLGAVALAAPITVPNHSFEYPDLPDYVITTQCDSWSRSDPNSSGVYNCASGTYPGTDGPDPAGTLPSPADGLQFGFSNCFNPGDSVTFTSPNLATVVPENDYILTVAVGNRGGIVPGQYRISLLVDGVEATFNTLAGSTIPIDTFTDLQAVLPALPVSSPFVGGNLQVQLTHSHSGSGTKSGDFDNVRLGVVPEPSTFILLTTAALGLLAYAWQRKRR